MRRRGRGSEGGGSVRRARQEREITVRAAARIGGDGSEAR